MASTAVSRSAAIATPNTVSSCRLPHAAGMPSGRRRPRRSPAPCTGSRSCGWRCGCRMCPSGWRGTARDLAPAEEHHPGHQHEQHWVLASASHSAIATPSIPNARHMVFSRPIRSDSQPKNGRVRPLVKRSMVSARGSAARPQTTALVMPNSPAKAGHLRRHHQAGGGHQRHHDEHQPEDRRAQHRGGLDTCASAPRPRRREQAAGQATPPGRPPRRSRRISSSVAW